MPNSIFPVERKVQKSIDQSVLSATEMKQLERQNTINALQECNWKIYGNDGAASLMDIKPTTLIERMKRMQINKPSK